MELFSVWQSALANAADRAQNYDFGAWIDVAKQLLKKLSVGRIDAVTRSPRNCVDAVCFVLTITIDDGAISEGTVTAAINKVTPTCY